MANPLLETGAEGGFYGLDKDRAVSGKPDWATGGGAAAYGQVPAAPPMLPTAAPSTGEAIAAGNQVYGQLPGYNASLGNVGANIQQETAGQLPEDVVNLIASRAADRGIAHGIPGSPNTSADYLSALGLTSLDMTQRGQQNLQSILPELPGASIASNPNFYVTPEQQYQAALQAAVFAAAPQPGAAANAAMGAARGGIAAGLGLAGGRGPAAGVAPTTIGQPAPASNNIPMLNDMISAYDPSIYKKSIGYDPTKYYDTDPTGQAGPAPTMGGLDDYLGTEGGLV